MTTRIMLVDSRPVRCAQITTKLRAAGLDVVASAMTMRQALRRFETAAPDVVVIDPALADAAEFAPLRSSAARARVRILPFPSLPGGAAIQGGGGVAEPDVPALSEAIIRTLASSASGAAAGGNGRLDGTPPRARLIVCIGASTGGLPVLQHILEAYPEDGPPTLIVQHIRGDFASGVAARLDRSCRMEVMEAYSGAPLRPGRVYLAPGDREHLELRGRSAAVCHLRSGPRVTGHRPSVDALFCSAARVCAPAVIGVLLTGMGRDGAQGLLAIRRQGGHTIVQDSATSTVYGMPRAAVEIGAAERVLPAPAIARAILGLAASDAVRTPRTPP